MASGYACATITKEIDMFGSKTSINQASNDVRSMIDEAGHMLSEASQATGERAEQLQRQSAQMLTSSMATVKEIAASTDMLVHENPWRSVAVSGLIGAGIGVALGLALARK
jgi:ElaB/YqjD/DUF883 family membrane-anchored ribosome-binding protein